MNEKAGRWYSVYPINKKVFLLSKFVIAACVLAYMIAAAFSGPVSDLVFLTLLLALILGWDAILNRIVSRPIQAISEAAGRMAQLDFSEPCAVSSKDELQTLADNLNTTASNLEHALAQRKELTDTLSHELKTPLGIIRAYAEGLGDAGPEKQEEYRHIIIEETEKMAGMVNALLDLSALEAGAAVLQTETVDLVELVETAAGREYVDTPSRPFQLSYCLPDAPIYIVADQTRLLQVLHNFMSNAKKFTPEHGKIHIEVSVSADTARFSIYNDGPQLTDDVWRKFHRDKSETNREGSGLGLAISAQILTMLGAIYGYRNKDSGVEFHFSLPVIS